MSSMRKRTSAEIPEFAPSAPTFGWKRQRSRHGPELFHYPSDLARQLWLYPLSIGLARMRPGDKHNPRLHDGYLLHYVIRGELRHQLRNRTYTVGQGDACLMDQAERLLQTVGGSQPAVSYWLRFNGKDMARCFSELRADRDPVFTGLDTATMNRLFGDLMRLTAQEDRAYEMRAAGLQTLLLAELYGVRTREQPLVSLGAREYMYSEPVRRGIDWLVRYYDIPHSLKQLCAAVGYSRSRYSLLFRQETGLPPGAWTNRYRVEQAKRLLATTDKSVAEVAAAVGVADANYFGRLFRSLTGRTPRRFCQAARTRRPARE